MAQQTYAAHDGTRLAYRLSGEGETVVLELSGGPGCVNYLPDAPAGFPARVVAPDPRGVGGSDGGPHGLDQAFDDLEALREHLAVDQWVVVGHSSGADLGLAYAAERPDAVRALVHVCGTGLQDDRSWHAAYLARRHEEPDLGIPYDAGVHRALLDDWRRWIREPRLPRMMADLEADLTYVAAADDIRPRWPLEQLAWGGLRVLPGVGHDFWHTHPDTWWDVIREALPTPRVVDPQEVERDRLDRRVIVAALATGLEDPIELMRLVATSDDVDQALQRLQQEFGLGQIPSQAVLDLQLRRATRAGVRASTEALAELDTPPSG